MTKKYGENYRSFEGIDSNLLSKMNDIYEKSDIDMVEKVCQIDIIRSYLSNSQISDFFGMSLSWLITKRDQKVRRMRKKRLDEKESRFFLP
jgi:hypothetical protein